MFVPVVMGAGIASQSAINSRLKEQTHSPYVASMFSFLVGFLFLLLLTRLSQRPIGVPIKLISQQPWWLWFGGVTAAFALTTNVLLFPILGSIQTTVLPVVGQILMSLIIDQLGLFHSPKVPLNVIKLSGVIILILGMLLATKMIRRKDEFEQRVNKATSQRGWQILGVLAGALLAVQAAINGYLGAVLNSPVHGAMISFLIAFVILMVISLGTKQPILKGVTVAVHHTHKESWIWSGGLLGSSYVFLSAWLVPKLGTGQVIIIALFGQLVFSMLIDQFGWFKANVNRISRLQIIGAIAMLLGTVMVKLA
jgi:transporter family-2 protein